MEQPMSNVMILSEPLQPAVAKALRIERHPLAEKVMRQDSLHIQQCCCKAKARTHKVPWTFLLDMDGPLLEPEKPNQGQGQSEAKQ